MQRPEPTLTTLDIVSLIVGTVLGAGIFKVPSLVAGQLPNEYAILGIWLLGGLISLAGALCYAELAASFPSVGGEYHFLQLAFGNRCAFLYGWARSTVIITGSLGILGITLGDYLSQIISLGPYSSTIWACLAILFFSVLNGLGIKEAKKTQNYLTTIEILGVLLLIGVGLYVGWTNAEVPASVSHGTSNSTSLGSYSLALVFVLLTFGGWNEAAYISAEALDQRHGIRRALILGLGIVTALYILVNIALLFAMGVETMGKSTTVASDLFAMAFGKNSSIYFSLLVIFSCLNSINATIIFGSRSTFAFGQDLKIFQWVADWHPCGAPRKAIIIQAMITMVLILGASFSRQSFESVVEFTAPVFWFFITLVGIALFALRIKYPNQFRLNPVPLYPWLPLMFIFTSLWLLWSSIAYSGLGAIAGLIVLGLGGLLIHFEKRRSCNYSND